MRIKAYCLFVHRASTAEKLGEVVRRRREDLGLSQESLAALSKIDRTYIGKVERGEVNISIEKLHCIAEGLNLRLSELIRMYE